LFDREIIYRLKEWKNKKNRKPLILRGARQVGKTTIIDLFSKEFDRYIPLNLDIDEDKRLFDTYKNIEELVEAIFLYKLPEGKDGKTLIFIDEIQNSPEAVAMLRYFYEKAGHLYVVAAGSLLETLIKKKISFPVGRVEYLAVRPCSFREFLLAVGEKRSLELISTYPFPRYAHEKLMKLFRTYTLIGGMPEIIQQYANEPSIVGLKPIYEGLIASYLDDVEKYGRNDLLIQVIRHVIQNSFYAAGSRIKFQGFGNSVYKNREVSEAFKTIEKAFLLQLVYPVTSTKLPRIPNYRRSPKLQFVDTGLVNYFAGLQMQILGTKQLDDVYEGRIAEHITGQELLTLNDSVLFKLNFWTREEKDASAEVDFIVQYKDMIIPVEVKSGASGKLRSLHQFIENSPHRIAVRIFSGEMTVNGERTIKGTAYKLINIPFYLINQLPDYLNSILTT
jgi:predicted AAA+ superfamily ATPase